MNLIGLSKYIQNETATENYLIEKGILKAFTNRPYCDSDKVKNTELNLIKCYSCKNEWHKRKGSSLQGKQQSESFYLNIGKQRTKR